MRLMMQKPRRPAMEPCIWGRMAPPVASAGLELVALACAVASDVAVDCAAERVLACMFSWSMAVCARKNIPAVCVEDWLEGPAAVWGECDEATTVALLDEGADSALAADTPTAVATGRADEVVRSRVAGGAASPETPARTERARPATARN